MMYMRLSPRGSSILAIPVPTGALRGGLTRMGPDLGIFLRHVPHDLDGHPHLVHSDAVAGVHVAIVLDAHVPVELVVDLVGVVVADVVLRRRCP